jgi:signal transduction histidine kinase
MKVYTLKKIIFVFVSFLSLHLQGQNYSTKGADSLKKLVKTINLQEPKAQLFMAIADIYLENDLDSAVVYRKKASLLYQKNKQWSTAPLQVLQIKEQIFFNDFAKAKVSLDAVKRNELSQWKDTNCVLQFYNLKSLYFQKIGNFKESIEILDPILTRYKAIDNSSKADLYLRKAHALQSFFNLKESIKAIEKAITIYKKENDKLGLAKSYVALSYHYMYLNDYDNALTSILKARDINDAIKSTAIKIREFTALGTIYFGKKNYTKTKNVLKEVLVLNKKLDLNQVNSIAYRYINLSNYELGLYREMIADCKNQLKGTLTLYEEYSLNYQIALAYNKLKEFENAKIYLDKLEALNAINPNLSQRDLFEFFEIAMVTEKGLGNVDKAFKISQDYIAKFRIYNDSLYREETVKNQVVFETKEKELKVKDLTIAAQKDKELLIKKENQKNFLIALLVFGLFLGIITFVFYKKIQKRNSKLELQNSIIEQQNKEISKSNATIKKTFSIISHDLRGPFNVLLGYTNYINDNFDECSKEELKSYIIKVNNAAQNNFNFTQQLLNWSLKQQNGITINKELCNLNEVVEKSIATLQPLAHQKDIAIHKDFLLEDDAKHYLDKDIIFNVLYNVISNSIKYSKDNTSIQIRTYADEKSLTIETKDNGKGMTIEQLQKLNQNSDVNDFNFIKNNNEYQGGFGLTYARELANLYGAQLVFESVLGEGTSVNFKIELQS